MILSLRIALKFHRGSSNKNILVSLMSLISVFIITIGIAVSIIALSVMHGFKYELNRRILAVVPHGEIKPVNASFTDWEKILIRVKKIPNIISACPYISFSGIIRFRNKWNLVYIRSIDLENSIFRVFSKSNWDFCCENKEQILLGKGIANVLNVQVGDWVTILITADNHIKNKILKYKKIYLQVSGIFNLNSQLDYNFAMVSLLNAQRYKNKISDIDGISIKVNDVFNIDEVISKIKEVFVMDHIYVSSWMDTYGYIYRDIQMVRIIIYLSMILIMGIFCFSVVTTLILSIKDKINDITILRILGAQNILVQYVFFWYGLMIYIVSSILGTGLGVVIALNITNLSMQYGNFFKKNIFSEGIYFINFLPSKLNFWDIFLILGLIFLIGISISWYSSLRMKKFNLSQILK